MKKLRKDFAKENPVHPAVAGDDRPRCTWKYDTAHNQKLERPIHCGLTAWEGAEQEEPRCLLHSRRKPEDFRARLLELIEAGASLAEARLEYLDLEGLDLSEMDLEGVWCEGTNLRGANLRDCHISFAGFQGADLTGACLAGAGGMHTCFNGTCLRGADLRELEVEFGEFEGADLTGADLTDADISQADLRGCHPRPEEWQGLKSLSRGIGACDLHPDDRDLSFIIWQPRGTAS